MTQIHDNPSNFKNDVMTGFAAAYSRYVERVPDASGFLRRGGPRAGKVSLVVGGGSGHYPSYGGIVGAGFADACVLGEIFSSPSSEQIYRVGRAADGGQGIVLSFGNYAGYRLNFAAAQERLVADGIDTRIVYVTDDIASAPKDEADRRRGIAGTFAVYKIGGAVADRGDDLDAVEHLMRAANAATSSFGVAFSGCTLPGQDRPLFHVEKGCMEFGLGIHGEPGTRSSPWLPAPQLAEELVQVVLAERPQAASGRAAVVVNGLGATKYEELFLLYGHVDRLLTAAGVEAVQPEVGELVTSLDMAGCSLSVTWLDEDLEQCWTAPADTVSFRRGQVSAPVAGRPATVQARAAQTRIATAATEGSTAGEAASDESVAAAAVARAALHAMAAVARQNEERLGQIDAVAGDGDHGIGMVRGLRAACAAADASEGGIGTVLSAAGAAFGDKAGGTSGILWGVMLGSAGSALGNRGPVTSSGIGAAVRAGADALQRVGKAEPGDKTMLDALLPFVDALQKRLDASDPLPDAWRAAAAAAVAAADATAPLVPRIGRARPLAERSIGTPDAGAISMGLVLTAVGAVLADTSKGRP